MTAVITAADALIVAACIALVSLLVWLLYRHRCMFWRPGRPMPENTRRGRGTGAICQPAQEACKKAQASPHYSLEFRSFGLPRACGNRFRWRWSDG